jgi:hypothetical protein
MTAQQIRKEGEKRTAVENTVHETAAKIRELIEQAETVAKANGGDESEIEERILELVSG